MYCARCATINPDDGLLCQNKDCGWYLANPVVPIQHQIAPAAIRGPAGEKSPADSHSPAPADEMSQNTPSRESFSSGAYAPIAKPLRRRWLPWAMSAMVLVGVPAAYFGGYLHAFTAIQSARSASTLPHLANHGGIRGHAALNPTRPVGSPVTKTHPTSSSPSSRKSTPKHTVVAAVHRPFLSGTIHNGQLQTTVWVGIHPNGPLYPVKMMVDTGAQHTMVSGNFFQAAGDAATGQTTTYAGIGGNETVGFWPGIWVYPQDEPVDPLIGGATEPGGLNRSMLGSESIIVLLGQNVIQQGTLTQNGTQWTLRYPNQ